MVRPARHVIPALECPVRDGAGAPEGRPDSTLQSRSVNELQLARRGDEALPRQRCEIFVETIRGLQKPRPNFAHRGTVDTGRKAEVIAEEFIRYWASIRHSRLGRKLSSPAAADALEMLTGDRDFVALGKLRGVAEGLANVCFLERGEVE